MVKSFLLFQRIKWEKLAWNLRLAVFNYTENTGPVAMFNYMEKTGWHAAAVINFMENLRVQF